MLCYIFVNIIVCSIIVVGLIFSFELSLDYVAEKLNVTNAKIVNMDSISKTIHQIRRPHPFTLGYQPPYYEHKYYRYPLEDVRFICEYLVYSDKDAKPIYKSTAWRKNGSPLLIKDDRITISVTIKAVNDSNKNITEFRVLSVLTILMVEESDYASYTCEYHNPLISTVLPGSSMERDFPTKINVTVQPMSPDQKCRCKPAYHTQGIHVETYVCFSEFLLLKTKEKVITKYISPGSLVTETATYATVADTEDVEVELMVKQGYDPSEHCCSIFLNWPDRFFNGSILPSKFPFFHSKTVTKGQYIHIQRQHCLCQSSFGTRNFTLYRHFINSTTGKRDTVEIVLYRKYVFIPDFSDSTSNKYNQKYDRRVNVTCIDNRFTTEDCEAYNFNSSFEKYINSEHIYFYLFLGATIALGLMLFCFLWCRCLRPISRVTLYNGREYVQFQSAVGGPVNILPGRFSGSHDDGASPRDDSARYDVFISYDEQSSCDSMTARCVKDLLTSQNMTVFDTQIEVLAGTPHLSEMEKAICKSSRFVVIVSESYNSSDMKTLEFDSIKRVIKGQGSKLKERMFVIQTEDCDMNKCYLLPSAKVPGHAREQNLLLDDAGIAEFKKWEKTTKPLDSTNWKIHLAGIIDWKLYESLVYLFTLIVFINIRLYTLLL